MAWRRFRTNGLAIRPPTRFSGFQKTKKGGEMTTDSITRTTKRGGRPRIAAEDRRSDKLAAAVTPETREAFREIAEAAGMTTSDYLRDVILAFLEAKRGGRS
jgi:hypothetical protein